MIANAFGLVAAATLSAAAIAAPVTLPGGTYIIDQALGTGSPVQPGQSVTVSRSAIAAAW